MLTIAAQNDLPCPAAALAVEYAHLDALDAPRLNMVVSLDNPLSIGYSPEEMERDGLRDRLVLRASDVAARSPAGAAFQLMLATVEIDVLDGCEMPAEEVAARHATVRRLAGSVSRYLEGLAAAAA